MFVYLRNGTKLSSPSLLRSVTICQKQQTLPMSNNPTFESATRAMCWRCSNIILIILIDQCCAVSRCIVGPHGRVPGVSLGVYCENQHWPCIVRPGWETVIIRFPEITPTFDYVTGCSRGSSSQALMRQLPSPSIPFSNLSVDRYN